MEGKNIYEKIFTNLDDRYFSVAPFDNYRNCLANDFADTINNFPHEFLCPRINKYGSLTNPVE